MAKTDWLITGSGGEAVIDMQGSMRLQISGSKAMLWKDRNDLANSQIIAEVRLYNNHHYGRGAMILRSDTSLMNYYRARIYGATGRTYYIDKIVSGVSTQLGQIYSSTPYNLFTKTRFRADGWQLSVEEYTGGVWNLITTVEETSHSIPSGYAGVQGFSYQNPYCIYFDNIVISEIP